MNTIRVTVEGDAEQVEAVKEQFYKQYIEGAGSKIVFEVPEDADDEADKIVKAAEEKDLKATKENYEDPIEDAGSVDFW